jgi:hypothetical protein
MKPPSSHEIDAVGPRHTFDRTGIKDEDGLGFRTAHVARQVPFTQIADVRELWLLGEAQRLPDRAVFTLRLVDELLDA